MPTPNAQNREVYPTVYVTASSDELIILHSLVEKLGGVVGLTSFRLTYENAERFALGAAQRLALEMNLDEKEITPIFTRNTLEDVAANKLAVILHGPDQTQLMDLTKTAELMAVTSDTDA